DQAAVGKKTRKFLTRSGHWKRLETLTREKGVFKPTVTEIANDVKIGSVDAAIIWDATAAQYSEIDAIPIPELNSGRSSITAGILKSSKNPTAALKFARYLSSRDQGLKHFESFGYEIIEGDIWKEVPELTFYAGSVNRRTLEPILKTFSEREGLDINTVYNGCGILTAQMNSIKSSQGSGFPDFYMACDVYYLDTVKDWFQDAVNVTNTDIVLVVQKGNPKNIRNIDDLKKQGIRIAVGQPDQCTIGVLTRKLLETEGVYQELLKENIVTQTLTSALLIPNVTTKSVDATFAYESDTLFEQDKLDIIRIDSPAAKAVQPYSISQSSDFKYLGRRLFKKIADSRELFEEAGFNWQLPSDGTNESNTDTP
ncbi:MAG TPA: hypothetical protein EYG38_16995, partial [Verrucomicrobia bacterium]|nr:hypothetical protein [Verrucomicrobiota bacterium]